jgi:hypothetical protein
MEVINPHRFATSAQAFDGFGNGSRSFNGVDDYVEIADNSDIPTGAQTITFWMKLDTLTEPVRPLTKFGSSDGQRSFLFVILTDGTIRNVINSTGNGGDNNAINSAVSTITTGIWYHVAMRFIPSTEQTLYINGSSVASDITSIPHTQIFDGTAPIMVGSEPTFASYFDGNIADVRIYDADIGGAGVSDLYNGTNITTNLVGHWIKDTPSLLDHAGNNDATNYGSKFSYDNPSPDVEFGSMSRIFDGANDHVDLGNSTDFSFSDGLQDEPFSLCAWIKCDSNNNFRVLSKDNGAGSGYEWLLSTDAGGNLNVYLIDGGTFRGREYTTPLPENEWIHVASTYDGSGGVNFRLGLKLYVNGVQVDNADFGSGGYVAMDASTNNKVFIARYGTTYSDGKIADARIYDTDLSASDISYIYNGTNVTTNLIGHWLTNNDDADDYAGTNDGTNNGSTYSYDNPNALVEYGGASRDFNGSSNYTDLGNDTSLDITDKIGISVWVKPDTVHNGAILSKWTSGTVDDNSYTIYMGQDSANDKISFILQPSLGVGGGSRVRCDGNISLSTTEWNHIACSFDGSTMRLYVNGVLDNSVSFTDTIKVTTNKLLFGKLRDQNHIYGFDGKIADVRLYDTDLSSTEVYELYKGVDHRTNLIGQWLTNSDDVEDKAGTNDGTNNGSTYSTDSPL